MTTPPMPDQGCTLEDVRRALEVGFAKIDGRLGSIDQHVNRTDTDVGALTIRVAALEKRVWGAAGAAALVGMLVPFLVQAMVG